MVTALIVSLLLAPVISGVIHIIGLDLDPESHTSLAKIFGGWFACLVVTRVGFHVAQRTDLLARRVLVIGSSQSAVRINNIIDASAGFCQVVDVIPPEAAERAISALPHSRIWSIVLADDTRGLAASALGLSQNNGVQVFSEAAFCENRLQRLDTSSLPPDWDVVVARSSAGRRLDVVHRVLDVIVSAGFLLFALPLMALVAAAIKLDSPGPVFYRQERVGRHGQMFMLRKFRSMTVNAEAIGAPMWAVRNDPRMTRIGRLIRRARIDELPQMLNVLAGEMSFIGPRPERPHFVQRLSAAIPNYADRACLKPGITGWAQIKFPYGASVEDARMKLAYDLYYVKHRSLFLNLLIMVATVRVILFQEGSR